MPTPDVPGLNIANTGNSTSFSFINGQMSSVATVTFSINPRQTGRFGIPAMEADIGGQRIRTQPLKSDCRTNRARPAPRKSIPGRKLHLCGSPCRTRTSIRAKWSRHNCRFFSAMMFKIPRAFNLRLCPRTVSPSEKCPRAGTERTQIGNRVYYGHSDVPCADRHENRHIDRRAPFGERRDSRRRRKWAVGTVWRLFWRNRNKLLGH